MLNPLLINTAVRELPESLAAVRFAFKELHPSEPVPTDEEVMAALNVAFQLTVDAVTSDPVL